MDANLERLLIAALGEDAVFEGGSLLAPTSAEGVGAVLRLAQEHRLPLRLTSGPPSPSHAPPGGAVLSLTRLAAISVDPGRGVVRAEAGATLGALAAALAAGEVAVPALAAVGVAVPGLGPDPGSDRVGALIARGGLPRRSLTGIEAALPGGELMTVGATVLKDVVGYDVTSLLLGSHGRLGVVVAAHLRVVPAGATVAVAEPAGERDVAGLTGVFDPEGILAGN
jgi:glycolate oxidase